MNRDENIAQVNRASGGVIAFLAASLIFVALAALVRFSTRPPGIDADRATAISTALAGIRKNEIASLENPGWVDRDRGIVRLPIQTALQAAAQEWRNPAAARADLIARANRATAPLPKQPAKPNPFQ